MSPARREDYDTCFLIDMVISPKNDQKDIEGIYGSHWVINPSSIIYLTNEQSIHFYSLLSS